MHTFLQLLSMLLLGVGFTSACPQDCICKHHVARCTCNGTIFHVIPYEFEPRPSELVITDCDMVVLYQWDTHGSDTPLAKVHIQGVKRLMVKENFILESNDIVSFSIKDCQQVNFEEMAFSNSQGIDRLTFVNVSIPTIPKHTFHQLQRIGNFIMVNSTIGTIRSEAFGFIGDVYHFSVFNTAIRVLEPNAFEMTTTRDFSFRHVTIESWSPKALVLSNIDNLIFQNLHAEDLQRNSMVVSNITNFTISHCHFDMIRYQAFWSMTNIQAMTFANNTIQIAEIGSLMLPLAEIQQLRVNSNRISCTYRICWLIEGRFDPNNPFLSTTVCSGPSKVAGKSLMSFGLVGVDDEDLCGDVFSGDNEIPVTTTNNITKALATNAENTSEHDKTMPEFKKQEKDDTMPSTKSILKVQKAKHANDACQMNISVFAIIWLAVYHILHCLNM